ncbi:hypothetical protein DMH18_23760 [Streptomyces sp. WAC 06783]|nr:hypothetical protein DMH18_23760 [Streptomyces sp. WAC 06783]
MITAVATMPATATVASAPPPMNSQRRRLSRDSLSSASASQSGVEESGPPGPNGPPCPKLMPRILNRLVERGAGGDNPAHGTRGGRASGVLPAGRAGPVGGRLVPGR